MVRKRLRWRLGTWVPMQFWILEMCPIPLKFCKDPLETPYIYIYWVCLLLFQWAKPDLSPGEQRQVRCTITCLILVIMCAWSIYKRIFQEIQDETLWLMKLISDAIAFTAAFVLMCIQCKVFGKLFKKWRNFNRIIYVHNITKKRSVTHQQQEVIAFCFLKYF